MLSCMDTWTATYLHPARARLLEVSGLKWQPLLAFLLLCRHIVRISWNCEPLNSPFACYYEIVITDMKHWECSRQSRALTESFKVGLISPVAMRKRTTGANRNINLTKIINGEIQWTRNQWTAKICCLKSIIFKTDTDEARYNGFKPHILKFY